MLAALKNARPASLLWNCTTINTSRFCFEILPFRQKDVRQKDVRQKVGLMFLSDIFLSARLGQMVLALDSR